MKRPAKEGLAQTRRLALAVLKATPKRATSFAAVEKALSDGKHRVVVEVPWYADSGTHQLILTRIEGDRIHFYNPAPSIGSFKQTLARRKEPDGTESAKLDDLRQLFDSVKGEALILPHR